MKEVIVTLTFLMSTQLYAKSLIDRLKTYDFDQKSNTLFAGIHWGYAQLTTDKSNEAGKKTGLQYGAGVSSLLEYELFDLNLEMSYYYVNFQSSRVDDVKYNLETKTLAIEGSPLYKLGSFSLGPKFQMILLDKLLVGPSDSSNETADDLTSRYVVGLNGFYNTDWDKLTVRLGLHYQKPISVGPRDVNITYLSLEIGQLF